MAVINICIAPYRRNRPLVFDRASPQRVRNSHRRRCTTPKRVHRIQLAPCPLASDLPPSTSPRAKMARTVSSMSLAIRSVDAGATALEEPSPEGVRPTIAPEGGGSPQPTIDGACPRHGYASSALRIRLRTLHWCPPPAHHLQCAAPHPAPIYRVASSIRIRVISGTPDKG